MKRLPNVAIVYNQSGPPVWVGPTDPPCRQPATGLTLKA